jgi:hypothetical protein
MTTASIIGSFVKQPAATPSAEYWVHIEQVLPPDDTASLGEVAELVDAIWGIDPCGQDEEQPATADQDQTTEATPPLTEAELAEIVRNQFRPGLCGMNANGDYPTQIKVMVAHPGEPYTLRLTHGRLDTTVTVEEDISRTIVVDNAASVDLDFPVVSGGTFAWVGSVYGAAGNMSGPPITLTGRTLSWGQPLTGSIAAAYRTRYDLVDVVVFGDGQGDPGECRAICFYHGLIDEIDLQPPDIEDDEGMEVYRQAFCGYADLEIGEPNNDEVTCYEDVSYVYRCQCSGEEAYQYTEYEVEVQCPPDIRCQFGASKCSAFMGHRTVLGGYVDCGETSGGLDDPDYRNQVCCDSVASLPKCRTTYSKNSGGVGLDPAVEEQYRRLYGDRLRLVAVSPDDGDCGVTKTVIEVHPKNCCAEAEPLAWDTATSVEVLAPSTSGIVGVTGGVPPYHWSVRGQGFALNQQGNLRDGFTDTPYVRIYATSLACGFCSIEVTDGCSVVNDGIKSTMGEWVQIGWPKTLFACPINGNIDDYVGYVAGYPLFEKIEGKYKLQQVLSASYYGTGQTQWCGEGGIYQYDPTNASHYSCFADFPSVLISSYTLENDHCFWEDLGYTIRTWWASHNKYLYEWRC